MFLSSLMSFVLAFDEYLGTLKSSLNQAYTKCELVGSRTFSHYVEKSGLKNPKSTPSRLAVSRLSKFSDICFI